MYIVATLLLNKPKMWSHYSGKEWLRKFVVRSHGVPADLVTDEEIKDVTVYAPWLEFGIQRDVYLTNVLGIANLAAVPDVLFQKNGKPLLPTTVRVVPNTVFKRLDTCPEQFRRTPVRVSKGLQQKVVDEYIASVELECLSGKRLATAQDWKYPGVQEHQFLTEKCYTLGYRLVDRALVHGSGGLPRYFVDDLFSLFDGVTPLLHFVREEVLQREVMEYRQVYLRGDDEQWLGRQLRKHLSVPEDLQSKATGSYSFPEITDGQVETVGGKGFYGPGRPYIDGMGNEVEFGPGKTPFKRNRDGYHQEQVPYEFYGTRPEVDKEYAHLVTYRVWPSGARVAEFPEGIVQREKGREKVQFVSTTTLHCFGQDYDVPQC